jgi:hypothetical protein
VLLDLLPVLPENFQSCKNVRFQNKGRFNQMEREHLPSKNLVCSS